MLKKSVITADNGMKVSVILTQFDSRAVSCFAGLKLKTTVSKTILHDCLVILDVEMKQ